MDWSESGIVLGTRKHGESSVILEVMTAAHGRHLGLVRGGRSRRLQPMLQPGNSLALTWRARLDEHLGNFKVDAETLRAARLMETASGIYGVQILAAHLRLLPERDPHKGLYDAFAIILDHLDEPLVAGGLIVRFELAVLDDLGFGLDLSECAASGATQDLVWVSPKSGRAVSRRAGEPYQDRLLALPAFLRDSAMAPDKDAVLAGFRLTAFFLERHVWAPRGLRPIEARSALIARIAAISGDS